MGDAQDLAINLAAGLESINGPCGENPFLPKDPRRQLWAEATGKAEEDLYQFRADFLRRNNAVPKYGNFRQHFFELWIENFTGQFDIWAQRAVCVVSGDAAIEEYDRWISRYLVDLLAVASDGCPESYPQDRLITELQYQLLPRVQHWKAAARRHSRDIEAQAKGQDQKAPPAGVMTPRISNGSHAPAVSLVGPVHPKTTKPKKRDSKFAALDAILRQISEAHPLSHAEVFRNLEGRIEIPNAQPFLGAGGWLAGFKRDKAAARAWLSRVWSRLKLPPFPRGPKR